MAEISKGLISLFGMLIPFVSLSRDKEIPIHHINLMLNIIFLEKPSLTLR